MRKLFGILVVMVVLLGCRNSPESTTQEVDKMVLEFQYQKMPDKAPINPEATAIVEGWEEFKAFNASMDVLYRATNNEDLALAIDDLIEKEKNLNEGNYPELYDNFQIKSRQQVIRTYLYKTKAAISENQPTTEPTVQMLEAYNALRKQFNVIVNSQLDKKLILDEQ